MLPRSETLAELIEPTLYALRNPNGEQLEPLVALARSARLHARTALREAGREVDPPSFELGVATSFMELLTITEQRSVLSDAARMVKSLPQGLETLHQIAVISRSGTDANQGELAERIGADRGNFNRRIKKLGGHGLIESRRRGQSLVYALTGLGMDVLTQLKPGWRAIHPNTQATITTEVEAFQAAQEEFGRIISSINSGLERIPAEGLTKTKTLRRLYKKSNTPGLGSKLPGSIHGAPEISTPFFITEVVSSYLDDPRDLGLSIESFELFLWERPKKALRGNRDVEHIHVVAD